MVFEHTTLGLSLIVKDEHDKLDRCLSSCYKLFDEIVVVTTCQCPKTEVIASKFTKKVFHFDWIDDFSAARNFALSLMTTDYVMWLDSDDILKRENFEKIVNLKQSMDCYDAIEMSYYYAHDPDDNPIEILYRERIWKRALNIVWHGKIHEATDYKLKAKTIDHRHDIVIDHYQAGFDPFRNIRILKKEYEKDRSNFRTAFYYGRDLITSGKFLQKQGVEILEDLLTREMCEKESAIVACKYLVMYYKEQQNYDKIKYYCDIALSISDAYAEFYVYMSEIFYLQGNISKAIEYNQIALTKDFTGKFSQSYEFYNVHPQRNINFLLQKAMEREIKNGN